MRIKPGRPQGRRARSLRAAARGQAKVGGKAAARLRSFALKRRLLDDADPGWPIRVPVHTPGTQAASDGEAKSPFEMYLEALAAPRRRGARGPEWRPLGPRSIPRGQTYGSGAGSTPSVSGRVTAFGVDPSDGRHLLLGSAGGGIWESRDRGRTWAPRTDDQPSLGIGALAFDPSDPSRVYAGTGEGNTLETPGLGLLLSTNGGTTWKMTATEVFGGTFFYQLVVDPTDRRRVFAATKRGIFVTTDAGKTWNRTKAGRCWDLSIGSRAIPESDNVELLAAHRDGLHVSRDAGASWDPVPLRGPRTFANAIGRMAVAHAPSDPGVAYVFAAKDDAFWLLRRDRPRGPFSRITPSSIDPPGSDSDGYGISQSWHDWCLAIAPDDPDSVFLGAVDVFRGRRRANGTWSWTDISSRSTGDSIHPDQHCLVFDPTDPRILYVGNDGGIFRSPDRGDSWRSINRGLEITEFEYLAQHPRNRTWMIGGTQDNGTLRHRRAGVWDQVALGDGGDCAATWSSRDTCFHSYYGMATDRSRSSGDRWTDVTPPVSEDYVSHFYPPLEANGSTLVRAGESVYVSDDEGRTWVEVELPPGGLATAMTFANDARILVGRDDGEVFSIDRISGDWGPPRRLRRPRGAYLSDLLVTTTGRYWATYSAIGGRHVFLSGDQGGSWGNRTSDLPDVPVNAIEADPEKPNRVWVATDVGVFQSTNGGRTWSIFGRGLPRALAVDLIFHPRLRLLRVGTRSRGVWEIHV